MTVVRRLCAPTNGVVSDFIFLLVTLVAFGLLALLVGFLDRRSSQ